MPLLYCMDLCCCLYENLKLAHKVQEEFRLNIHQTCTLCQHRFWHDVVLGWARLGSVVNKGTFLTSYAARPQPSEQLWQMYTKGYRLVSYGICTFWGKYYPNVAPCLKTFVMKKQFRVHLSKTCCGGRLYLLIRLLGSGSKLSPKDTREKVCTSFFHHLFELR